MFFFLSVSKSRKSLNHKNHSSDECDSLMTQILKTLFGLF